MDHQEDENRLNPDDRNRFVQCISRHRKVYFTFILAVVGVVQGAYFTYLVGVFTTLEKRYSFGTVITGVIFIADNLSPVMFGIVLGHYSKDGHRPRIMFCGMMAAVFGYLLSCSPYLVYGARSSMKYVPPVEDYTNASAHSPHLCAANYSRTVEKCDYSEVLMSYGAVCIFFLGNFFSGFGSVAYYTVGMSYLDDSVRKNESALFLGITFALRLVGPSLGFMLSGFCLKLYENPLVDPGFSNNDPEWIGAWWVGFLILGICLCLASIPILLFPRNMSQNSIEEKKSTFQMRNRWQSLCSSMKRITKSKVLVFHALSITFQIDGIFGYFTYMPKYMQSQFGQTASLASIFSGTAMLLTMIFGVLLGGLLIHFIKPRPRYLTGYMIFVELFSLIGLICALYLDCSSTSHQQSFKRFPTSQNCSTDCHCDNNIYEPVCAEGKDFFQSPCFAGCQQYISYNNTLVFYNCSCSQEFRQYELNYSVKQGSCTQDCDNFLTYFSILSASKILIGTTKVGNILITLRSAPDGEKAIALGAVESLISIFATIPYPIIYGYVIDGTCLIWGKNCDGKGNCLLYDNEKFKNHLHMLSISFFVCGIVCELFVFYFSKDMKHIYETSITQDALQNETTLPLNVLQ